jgi:transcriptional regulator with XRE-family HTH domain
MPVEAEERIAQAVDAVGRVARARREDLGLTLREVASNAGLSLPYVANLEKGRKNPTLDTLVRLSIALDLPLSAFF